LDVPFLDTDDGRAYCRWRYFCLRPIAPTVPRLTRTAGGGSPEKDVSLWQAKAQRAEGFECIDVTFDGVKWNPKRYGSARTGFPAAARIA